MGRITFVLREQIDFLISHKTLEFPSIRGDLHHFGGIFFTPLSLQIDVIYNDWFNKVSSDNQMGLGIRVSHYGV